MHHAVTPGKTLGLPPYAVDFLKTVPVVWKETKYLGGYPGIYVVIARKNGDRWYIAGVNGENMDKELSIDLSPLGTIPSTIEMIMDGDGVRDLQTAAITPIDGKISIRLQPYGGFTGSTIE